MSLALGIVVILAATLLISRSVRGRKTPAPVTAIVFGLVVIALMVGAYTYTRSQDNARESDRRTAAAASNAAAFRAYDAQVAQYAQCVSRVGNRADIRDALFAMVDLSDLFPDSPAAAQYTASRRAVIDQKAKALDVGTECGPQPTPPTTTGGNP